jgi:hypothetical protein
MKDIITALGGIKTGLKIPDITFHKSKARVFQKWLNIFHVSRTQVIQAYYLIAPLQEMLYQV